MLVDHLKPKSMKWTDLNVMQGGMHMSFENTGFTVKVVCKALIDAEEGRELATTVTRTIC